MNAIAVAQEMLASDRGIIANYAHLTDAIIEARSLKVEFVGENEEVGRGACIKNYFYLF